MRLFRSLAAALSAVVICSPRCVMAVDAGRRNKHMAISDAESGRLITTVQIDSGVDANTFDPSTEDAFASNGDGTLTVVQPPIVPGSFTLLVLEQ